MQKTEDSECSRPCLYPQPKLTYQQQTTKNPGSAHLPLSTMRRAAKVKVTTQRRMAMLVLG